MRRSKNQGRSPWLIAGAGLVLYTGLVFALTTARIRLDIPLPLWAAQLVPPVVYGLAITVALRKVSRDRWFGATLTLWAVHLVLGTVTQVVGGQSPIFPPPPLPAMLWVPLLLVPLHRAVSGARGAPDHRGTARMDGRRSVSAPAQPTSTGAKAREAAAAVVTEERRDTPTWQEGDTRPASLLQTDPQVSRGTPNRASAREASPTQRLLDEMLARDTSGEVVRISFARISSQLPPAGFQAPLERVAERLTEPGFLLVPRRLALIQLGEGLVRAGWEVVTEQFPRSLFAVTDDEIRRQLPDGQLVLPLDEIVSQMPAELFLAEGPLPDPPGIESFPALFQHIPSKASVESPTAAGEAARPEPPVEAGTAAEWPTTTLEPVPAIGDHEAEAPKYEARIVSEIPPSKPTASEDMSPDDRAPEPRPVQELVDPAPVAQDRHDAQPCAAEPMLDKDDTRATSPDRPVRQSVAVEALIAGNGATGETADSKPVAVSTPGRAVDAVPAPSQVPAPAVRSAALEAARRVAARLTPLVPLDVDAQVVDGVTLFTVSSPGLGREQSSGVARLMLRLLGDTRLPWPVEQLTLRGPAVALVLTPLARLSAGGPILVTALAPGGSLALLEILCRRAADRAAEPRGTVAPERHHHEPDLVDVAPPRRLRQAASSLVAVGPVTVSALRDAETEQSLYLFLPAGSDARMIGGFALDVARALRKAGEVGVVCRSAVLRSGRHRMVIQLTSSQTRSGILVAGGETDRPGLAFRQVESAALTLSAL